MNKRNSKRNAADEQRTSVLIAVADEEHALAIAEFVQAHRWPEDVRFHLLYVVEEPSIRRVLRFSPDIAQQIIDEDEIYGGRLTKKLQVLLAKAMPTAEIEGNVRRGFAKNEILETADDIKADYIVLGSHGRLGVSALLLGSVSLAVMMEAKCSVLVVRLPIAHVESKTGASLANEDLPKQMISYAKN
jgi:nucleotide-binding universal stress UspA family protein